MTRIIWSRAATRTHPLLACRRGNVAAEFALTLPVLVMLLLGCAEIARFVPLNQKLTRVAVSITDLVARAPEISNAELADIFRAAGVITSPFDLPDQGVVIVSSVHNPNGSGARIAWQRSGAGSHVASAKTGAEGGTASLPGAIVVRQGESMIVAEVFFAFEPLLGPILLAPREVHASAHHHPRLGTLTSIQP
jgi:Flp pilus assembly protein TadG